jgi:hypothetical protein
MILINFSHPLTEEQITQVQALTGQPVDRLIALPVQFDDRQPYPPQLETLLQALPLTTEELQTAPILVNLPSLNFIAGMALAGLHGRMGYFPPILRLRPVAASLPPRYEVAEVLNLQTIREEARKRRF